MTQYMLLFSLGPVQPFIAQARKTRDLWLGSFLLSKLMEAAMKGIDEQAFVFPTNQTVEEWIPDLPNKYIAIFDDPNVARKAVCCSEQQIEQRWGKICEQIGKEILKEYYNDGTETRKIWDRQTNFRSLFEIFWVIVAGSEDDYTKWLQVTQSAHDARKRLRNFSAQDEPGEKSTISGEREALRRNQESRKEVQKFWRDLTKQLSANDISKDGSERLDAIDTIKRFALYSSELKSSNVEGQNVELDKITFPSTSSIATAHFVEKLLQHEIPEEVLRKWRQATSYHLSHENPNDIPYLKSHAKERYWLLRRDGDLYFPETFTPRYLKDNYRITFNSKDKEQEPDLELKDKTFIQNCLDALKDLHGSVGIQPTPYYALVQMDGDKMGTLMSSVESKCEHRCISNALSSFARKHVPRIVQHEYPGRLIYAGGDDVLALTPLDGMLDIADKLQKQYKQEIGGGHREKVTASMGIAIGHHFTPLSVVRRAALDAEKLAKDRYGRNALVVTIIRHSGEQTRVGCRWYYTIPSSISASTDEQIQVDCLQHHVNPGKHDDKQIEPITLFKEFYQCFINKQLSPKSIHVLLNEVPILVELEECAQISEIKRVLKRQSNDQGAEGLDEKRITELAVQIVQLACAMDQVNLKENKKESLSTELHQDQVNLKENKKEHLSTELHADVLRRGLVEVFGWLLVMAFLAREGLER